MHLVLVLYGDVPLVRARRCASCSALAGAAHLALLTTEFDDPNGYGRVVRNARGKVRAHRRAERRRRAPAARDPRGQHRHAGADARSRSSAGWRKLGNRNAQGEYYLTDIIAMAAKDKYTVAPLVAPTVTEVLGVNDKLQLAALEREYRRLRARELMLARRDA